MNAVKAIKTYFEQDGGRKITMEEMKALSKLERQELGLLACDALGITLIEQ